MANRQIVHVEIPSKEPKEAAKFYADLFGWKIQTPEGFEDYPMFGPLGDNMGGGFTKLDDYYKPNQVLIYVDSDDIEADLKKAESLGAKTVREKTVIEGVGWFGIFEDPTGNHIALYTSMNPS